MVSVFPSYLVALSALITRISALVWSVRRTPSIGSLVRSSLARARCGHRCSLPQPFGIFQEE